MNIENKHVAVLGFGLEGQSVVNWLLKHGAIISVLDEYKSKEVINEAFVKYEEKGVQHIFGKFDNLTSYDLIIVTQGIRLDRQQILAAEKDGVKVTTLTNIFMELCPCPIIGVTGTKGKGTTSALITELLKKSGRIVYSGGNIGTPPLDFLDKLDNESYVVLEMSSFQLFSLTKSPHIAVILMVTCEHMDYHKDENEYIKSKQGIVKYQNLDDITIVNCDYPNSLDVSELTACDPILVSTKEELEKGCFLKDGYIVYRDDLVEEQILPVKNIFIPGKHNHENVIAAVAVGKVLNIATSDIQQVLMSFKGLPHRLELVSEIDGVKYYNDSFSTIPETTIAAIEAFEEPKVLILGGSSKNSDFKQLGKAISNCETIRGIIGIGVEWPKIKSEIRIKNQELRLIEGCRNMLEIVEEAKKVSQSGDVVLLSPACPSFDMFKNYKDRGEQFKKYSQIIDR